MKRTALYFGMAFVLAALLAAPAFALEAKLSGQVNQMAMWADDGDNDDFFVTDNDSSSTRIRFTGEETFGAVKAGVQVEIEAQRNASNLLTIDQNNDGSGGSGGFEWNDRWLNVYFDTKVGKFEIGKGDSAANNTTEVDLSGTSVITYSDINATAGGFVWRNSDGTAFRNTLTSASSPNDDSIGETRNNFDGSLSRTERLRYNTPTFGGLYLAGSVANGDAYDASVWYTAELYGKLAAAIGFTDMAQRAAYTQAGGSISWLAPFGLNLTAAYGRRYLDNSPRNNPTSYYGKVGYKWDIHAVSVEYGVTEDLIVDEDEATNYGAAYVINPWKPVEFYAAYRIYMLDADGVDDPEDIQQVMAGTRIKF
jgi:hypothetical protein